MRRVVAWMLPLAAAWGVARAAGPSPADFQGTWRVSKWVGESQSGFSGPDPNSVVGSTVRITPTAFRSPQRTCELAGASVSTMGNRDIETELWGGQKIVQLRLSEAEKGGAFGAERTPVFQDKTLCVAAIMLDHDHILDAFGSGAIYKLDREQ